MPIYVHITLTVLIYTALFWASMLFNNYIDGRREMYDGETAVWVILGVTYTNIGAACVMVVWWHELHPVATPLRFALFVIGVLFSCYLVSGIPMAIGDAMRSQKRRNERGK